MARPPHRTFHWEDAASELSALIGAGFELEEKRRWFENESERLFPPLVFPVPDDCWTVRDYVAGLPSEPGPQLVLVMQAGAFSLGRFDAGDVQVTKTFKRYVVRGNGRAQPTHLKTRGKSKYGSRLRLQNAKRLLEETNEKIAEWEAEFGPPEQIYFSGTTRLWADLFSVQPPPPFEREAPAIKIPLDLRKPTTDVMLRAYESLCWGRIEERDGGS